MGDQPSQLIVLIKHHSVRTRRATRVRISRGQDGELVVRRVHREVKILVVLVNMRVVVAANGLALLVVVVTSLLGRVNGTTGVAVAATGVVTGTGLQRLGESHGTLDEEEGSERKDLGTCQPLSHPVPCLSSVHTLVSCMLTDVQ